MRKFESEFSKTENYKKLAKQNELPELKIRIPKIIGHDLDNTMYNRVYWLFKNKKFI